MVYLHGFFSWLGAIYLVVPQLMAVSTLFAARSAAFSSADFFFLLCEPAGSGTGTAHADGKMTVWGSPGGTAPARKPRQGERHKDALHPGALSPCAPDPGWGTRDGIPESWKPPVGTVPGDTNPSSVASSQKKVSLASPGGENMDPPKEPNPCHQNVVSLLPPKLDVVQKTFGQ